MKKELLEKASSHMDRKILLVFLYLRIIYRLSIELLCTYRSFNVESY